MSTKDTIREFIKRDILSDARETSIKDDDQLIEMGIIDSMGIMTLLVFLEEKYDLRISAEDLLPENFSTINAISGLVDRQLKR